jgi:hypothetical protein
MGWIQRLWVRFFKRECKHESVEWTATGHGWPYDPDGVRLGWEHFIDERIPNLTGHPQGHATSWSCWRMFRCRFCGFTDVRPDCNTPEDMVYADAISGET